MDLLLLILEKKKILKFYLYHQVFYKKKMNLKNYYNSLIIYDLISKLNIKNIYTIPKITKIYLNIDFSKKSLIEKKRIIKIILFLNLITNQQPFLTKKQKNNIFLKVKKNSIIGCKITLRKEYIYLFLEKIIFYILPNLKKIKFNMIKINNIFNFKIKNLLNFFEFKNEFFQFKDLSFFSLNVSIQTNSKNNSHLFLLLNSFFFF